MSLCELPLDLGFLSLHVILDGADVLVGHADGRTLFGCTRLGALAPSHLQADRTTLPWEDTDTVRLAIVEAVNAHRGVARAGRTPLGRAAGSTGEFFLPRQTAAQRRDAAMDGA